MIDTFAISGTKSDVRNRLEELKNQGITGVILGGPLAKTRLDGLQKLAELNESFK